MTWTEYPSAAGAARIHAVQGGRKGLYAWLATWCGLELRIGSAKARNLLAPTKDPADCRLCLAAMRRWERHHGKKLPRPKGER